MEKFFYQLSPEEAIKRLRTNPKAGLSSKEAKVRHEQYGPNKIEEGKKRPLVFRFLDQFRDLLIIVLIIAALLAYYLDDFRGGTVLLAIVLINAIIGFYQEYKAEKILESLKKIIRAKATVIRDGQKKEVDEWELVPGDLVYLEEGGAVPADIRLILTTSFSTNDFILTGESVPQEKSAELVIEGETTITDQDNLVFLGTTIAKGNAYGVVYGTGMDTAIGRIARTSETIEHDLSPLQQEMNALAKTLTKVAGVIAISLFVINLFLNANQYENTRLLINVSILFAIGVAAACVPQGLPAQISVALSLGVGRLAKKNAIVKKLSAVETLGSATVVCSDKTGTITKNEMTIIHCFVNDGREFEVEGDGYEPNGAIKEGKKTMKPKDLEPIKQFFEDGFLASNGRTHEPDEQHRTWYAIGDPTEAAFTPLAIKAGLQPERLEKNFPLVQELPFDSNRKRMTIIREHKGKQIGYMKGGLESVLTCCSKINHAGEAKELTDKERKEILKTGEKFSGQAFRVIALAYRDFTEKKEKYTIEDEKEFVFAGFVAMLDPPRKAVREAIKAAYDAHIRVMMITGDNPITAKAIAERIGLRADHEPLTVKTGDEIKVMPDVDLKDLLKKRSVVFSRVSPEDKYRLVNLLKEMGEVVAVTGDGVNDTLSLKRSDIGVAMGKLGSEVAKETSEIILLDDHFGTLIQAIKEGRTIFYNLKKTIIATVTANFGELSCVLIGFVGVAYGLPIPITAVQILAVDLIAEILPLTALTFDPASKGLLTNKPRNLNFHVMNRYSLSAASFFGVISGLISYTSFFLVYRQTGSLEKAQAAAYAGLVVCQLINVLSERTEQSFFSKYLLTNRQLWISIAISTIAVWSIINISALSIWFGFGALTLQHWIYPFAGALILLILHEVLKSAIGRGWIHAWLSEE